MISRGSGAAGSRAIPEPWAKTLTLDGFPASSPGSAARGFGSDQEAGGTGCLR